MGGFSSFLLIYLLGGLTFIPLLLIGVLLHAHLTFPIRDETTILDEAESLLRPGDASDVIKVGEKGLDERFHTRRSQDPDVAAGYFAVCREYVPGGINGKPPERTTPTGSTTISSPSPSVYQSMYRSIFDRKQSVSPLESKGTNKPPRRGGNIFYVVLRHSHLLLFDDTEMIEVRYVLSLAHHDVSIYGGGEDMPDGELFIKRNALCLTRKPDAGEMTADGTPSKPFYLFNDNTSEKEDFYFSMLKNQERKMDAPNNPPIPLQFDVKDMIGLVQRLHSSEEHLQTRWINAMLGRIFLGLYKTSEIENFIRAKITKKISRVKKPSFLSGIVLRDINMGEGAPLITNPRLKDLTVDGDCSIEADVRYTGNFRLEVAATARIDLGTRFKAREVNLLLAVVLKKIEGHVVIKIKPPPSNRVWMTFAHPPKIEMSIEPIVSSRQITYTIILRQIENRIKEVVAETIVMPYWDDIAFYSTEGKKWRGGVWVDDTLKQESKDLRASAAEDGEVDEVEHLETDGPSDSLPPIEKSMTTPIIESHRTSTAYPRKATRSLFNLSSSKATASSTSVETTRSSSSDTPKALRQGGFASASSPIVAMDSTNVDAFKAGSPPEHNHAASAMAAISARSPLGSPAETPVGSPSKQPSFSKTESLSSASSGEVEVLSEPYSHAALDTGADDILNASADPSSPSPSSIVEISQSSDAHKSFNHPPQNEDPSSPSSAKTTSQTTESSNGSDPTRSSLGHIRRQDSSVSSTASTGSSETPATPPKRIMLATVANAAATARRWGLDALRRSGDHGKDGSLDRNGSASHLNQPMGRGRPIPFTDTNMKSAPIQVPKRKSLAPPVLPKRGPQPVPDRTPSPSAGFNVPSPVDSGPEGRNNPPPLPTRPVNQNIPPSKYDGAEYGTGGDEGIFVVEAPADSEPTTPLVEHRQIYMPPSVADDVEEDGDGGG